MMDTLQIVLHTILIVATTGMIHGLWKLVTAVITLDKRVFAIEQHLKLKGSDNGKS